MSKANYEDNLLDRVPLRIARETGRFEGRAQVGFPRFRTRMGKTLGRWFGKSEMITLKLDDKCTVVWDLIDGARNVQAIGVELERKFGEEVTPLYERLGQLLGILESNKMIQYQDEGFPHLK